MRYLTGVACAALAISALPLQAAGSKEGRKGTTMPALHESAEDIASAAKAAESAAARSIIISDLGDLTIPTPFSGFTPEPLAIGMPVTGIEPVIIVSETSPLPYTAIGAVLLPIIFAGGGGGAGVPGVFNPPATDVPTPPPPPPSGPGGGGDVPVPPPVPEPATWLMLLLGFAAVGSAVRRSVIDRTVPTNPARP